MIPALTVTDERVAEVLLRALANEWDAQMRRGKRENDRAVFELLIDAGVQAARLGVDHTRYLSETVTAIVDGEIRHLDRVRDDITTTLKEF